MLLKTYECEGCGLQQDRMVNWKTSDEVKFCTKCGKLRNHFVVMNCRGLHYRYMSRWTEDVLENSFRLGEVGSTIGKTPAHGKKEAAKEDGTKIAEKYNNGDVRAERRDKTKFKINKRKGKGKIYAI